MKEYFKSLWSPRLIAIFGLIGMMSLVMIFYTSNIWFYVYNVFFWFVIDYTLGVGRIENSTIKKIAGSLFIVLTIFLLIWFK